MAAWQGHSVSCRGGRGDCRAKRETGQHLALSPFDVPPVVLFISTSIFIFCLVAWIIHVAHGGSANFALKLLLILVELQRSTREAWVEAIMILRLTIWNLSGISPLIAAKLLTSPAVCVGHCLSRQM
jgi:hypothetical protein